MPLITRTHKECRLVITDVKFDVVGNGDSSQLECLTEYVMNAFRIETEINSIQSDRQNEWKNKWG